MYPRSKQPRLESNGVQHQTSNQLTTQYGQMDDLDINLLRDSTIVPNAHGGVGATSSGDCVDSFGDNSFAQSSLGYDQPSPFSRTRGDSHSSTFGLSYGHGPESPDNCVDSFGDGGYPQNTNCLPAAISERNEVGHIVYGSPVAATLPNTMHQPQQRMNAPFYLGELSSTTTTSSWNAPQNRWRSVHRRATQHHTTSAQGLVGDCAPVDSNPVPNANRRGMKRGSHVYVRKLERMLLLLWRRHKQHVHPIV